MSKTTDTSTSRLLVQLKLHTREVFLIASFSCQMSTQWCHQRFCSEPRFTTQTSTSWEEFASIFWKTSGLLHSKSGPFSFQSRRWCLYQTWMILLTKRSPISGRPTKRVPSRKLRNGLSNMLPSELEYLTQVAQIIYEIWMILTLDTKGRTMIISYKMFLQCNIHNSHFKMQ